METLYSIKIEISFENQIKLSIPKLQKHLNVDVTRNAAQIRINKVSVTRRKTSQQQILRKETFKGYMQEYKYFPHKEQIFVNPQVQNQNQNNQKDSKPNQTLKNINFAKTCSSNKENLNKRRTLLSIKSKPSLRIEDAQQFHAFVEQKDEIKTESKISLNKNKQTSLELTTGSNSNSFYIDEDPQKIFQLLHKKRDIMVIDHDRLIIEAKKFKSLLNEFHGKFKQVKTDRDSLSEKVNKYEYYFKEMRLKHIPDDEEDENSEKNQNLKILNLQKKVETLNYIIKQYRINNNQQIKNFQLKLKQFRPNIEKELTQKLAQTNEKYERLLRKVQFFEKQCKSSIKTDWHELMMEFQQTKKSNQNNMKFISELTSKINYLNEQMKQNEEKMRVFEQLQERAYLQRQQIQKLADSKFSLEEEIQQKDRKIDQLNHACEQYSFKLEGLKNLQFRIENKDKTIKKNTVVINKLQCENIELKSKIQTVLGQFQARVFCEKNLQQSLMSANSTIYELTNRLHQTFLEVSQNPHSQANRQKQYFIGHMFEKVKSSYNQIISEYQNQLKLINVECKKWKETFELISKTQDEKLKLIEKGETQLAKIQQKKVRCQQNFNRLSNQALDQGKLKGKQCLNCKHLIAYWGQLENSFSQLKNILQNVFKMELVTQIPCLQIEDSVNN